MVLLRLPGEVREIFREWLLRHYPDRVRHVMSLVRDTRGGKDYNSAWGERMTGEGAYATLMQQRMAQGQGALRARQEVPGAADRPVHAAAVDDGQMSLF